MKALLLLAGRSKRFWPLADKTLFPLCGKTLLEHQVARLREGGVTDITIVAGKHNLEQIASLLPDIARIEQRDLDLGMQGALLDALPSCEGESVLVISGNDVIESGAYRSLAEMLKPGVDGVVLAKEVERYFPGGYLTVEDGRIKGIVEKPGAGKEPSNLVNIVAHVHRDASVLLAALQAASSKSDDGYEQALDALCQSHHYAVLPYAGVWQPVKYPWHLLSLLPILLAEQKPSVHKTAAVHPSAVIEGNVVIEEGARILPNACIAGPCFIGKKAIVGNNALVRGSSIGEGCVVGFGSEVKESVLAAHCWLHMAYCGDSVLGENVAMGGGTITGNLRLDEGEIASVVGDDKVQTGRTKLGTILGDGCRIGIHVGINPGIKVGKHSFISSGVLVTQDVADGSFVTMKEGSMHVRENRQTTLKPEDREKYRSGI